MLNMLQQILDFIQTVSGLVWDYVMNGIYFIQMVGKGIVYATTAVTYLPVQYQAVLTLAITFSLIVTIIHLGN